MIRIAPLPAIALHLACALALLFASIAHSSPPQRVGTGVAAALEQHERVRVLVTFDLGPVPARAAPRNATIARATDALLSRLGTGHHALKRRFELVPAVAIEIDRDALMRLKSLPQVRRIDLDSGGHGTMMQSAPIVRVNETFAAGLTGSGAKIAVVDSGIDTDHADFSGRIVAQQCFCSGLMGAEGCCPNGADSMSGPGSAEDDLGHGTNVAGIAAGGGAVATRGAAPAASIVAVKVLDGGNSFCCASDVVAALDWIAPNHPDTAAVNASLGTSMQFAGACDDATAFTEALATAVDNLLANGTMMFASSGNQGSATLITAPACTANTNAVGATWDNNFGLRTALGCTGPTGIDRATCFTSSNDQVDLYAPGAEVTSSYFDGGVATFVGTSQASPLAAGCATALRAEFPAATAVQVRAALRASPTIIIDAKNGLAFPRLDCASAALELADPDRGFFDGFEY
jgi:subtilisin family serine protease